MLWDVGSRWEVDGGLLEVRGGGRFDRGRLMGILGVDWGFGRLLRVGSFGRFGLLVGRFGLVVCRGMVVGRRVGGRLWLGGGSRVERMVVVGVDELNLCCLPLWMLGLCCWCWRLLMMVAGMDSLRMARIVEMVMERSRG